jgi:uncharacterized membrane protein (DUF373 family)
MATALLLILSLILSLSSVAGQLIRMEVAATPARSDSCTDYRYYNPHDTYVASQMVTYGHYLSDTDFCRNNAYYDKAFVTPIVICSICAFMLLCFFAGMFGRMFYDECKCRPEREEKEEFNKQKTLNATLFYILCILVLVLDQLVFVGNGRVDVAVQTLQGATGAIKETTYDMHTGGKLLIALVQNLTTAYDHTTSTCSTNSTAFDELQGNITQYSASAQQYTEAIVPIQDFLSDVDSGISEYGILYRQLALYFIWALAIVFGVLLLTLKWYEFRYGMKQVMWFGVCTYALYVCLCLPWTYATSVLADICMEPSYNAVKSMPVQDSIRNIGAYYSTCTGNCTLTTAILSAQETVVNMNATAVALLTQDCANNTQLQEFRALLDTVHASLSDVTDTMSCGPIQEEWFVFWNRGVCQQLYSGTFLIWGSQILTSLFLFVLIVCVSVTYQFYGEPKSPYPLFSNSKVVPSTVGNSQVTLHSLDHELGLHDAFGDMAQPSPERHAAPIGRVLSFHSDGSEELNGSFF